MDEDELPGVKGRIGTFGNLFLGLLFLFLCFWLTFLLLKNFYGEIRLPEKPLFTALKQGKPKIALFQSTNTKIALPEFTSWLNNNLADWEKYFSNRRLDYKVITSKDLENGIKGYDLLILPSAICLSEKEKSAIKKFLSTGGGVFATGPLGSRNEQGEWQGWNFLSSLFGVEVTGELEQKNKASASLTLRANSPLSNRVPPGSRLEVTTYERPLTVQVLEPRASPVGYWFDFQTFPDLLPPESEKNCGLVYGEYRRGRFVWVAFELGTVVGAKFQQVVWDRLLSNSISWLRKEPVGWFNPWPAVDNRAEAAVVFACVPDHRYIQALNALKVLNKESIRGTFFLSPEEARNNPEVTGTIAENAEVGLHALAIYRNQPYEEQFARLKEGKELIEQLTGKKIHGFLPPEEDLYDSSTIRALSELNYKYICSGSLDDRTYPTQTGMRKKPLTFLPKTGRGDYELLNKDSLRDPAEVFDALKNDFLPVYEVQGAYILLFHSHLLCAEKNIPALMQFIEFCKGKNVWFASCEEIADWWQSFENVFVNVKRRGRSRIVVNLSNEGSFVIKDIQLFIAAHQPVRTVSIKTELVGVNVPEHQLMDEGKIIVLKVKSLGPHTSQTFFIDCK